MAEVAPRLRISRIAGAAGVCFNWAAMTNSLYYGDNLEILREHVPDESVDLVYLDPPFNSNASYNVLFREQPSEQGRLEGPAAGGRSNAQTKMVRRAAVNAGLAETASQMQRVVLWSGKRQGMHL